MARKNQVQGNICGFIQKLWDILQNSEFDKILLWNTNGTSFAILNPSLFQEHILPAYFRHSKLKSFVRQLNMYGFRKSHRAKEHLAFSNPDFRRDEESKLPSIRRRLAKRSRATASKNEPSYGELENLHNSFNVSLEEPLASSNDSELPISNEENDRIFYEEEVKEDQRSARPVLEIQSYGRLQDEGRSFAPFISPYSYASIKSENRIGAGQVGKSSMQIDLFKNGSTDEEQPWPYVFTSCEYFL